MIEQQKFEQIKVYLDQENHENAITLLEEYIEENPEELTYYWYLGLTYLLQESEELAQEIWLSIFLQGNLEEVEQWTLELINFLEIKVQENITEKKLGNAKIIYEAIFIIDADYKNSELLNNLVQALSIFASNLSFNKEYETASDIYLEALRLNPNHSISWHSLALNYYYSELYDKSEEAIQKAIELNSLLAENYHVLGLILEQTRRYFSAIKAYQKAIKQGIKIIDTYDNLGKIYIHENQAEKAIEIYKMALNIIPSASKKYIFHKLGNAYNTSGNKALAALNFGYSDYFQQQRQLAIIHFEEFLASQIEDIQAYVIIIHCYILLDLPISAISLIENVLKLFPTNLTLQRLNQAILPIIYNNKEEVKFYRDRFSKLLEKLIQNIDVNTAEDKQEALKSIQIVTNFYLGYQGENDLEIQIKYGNYAHTILSKIYPQYCKIISLSQNINQRKIKIGYLSLRLQSMGLLYLGWLKHCDKAKFEIYVYDISKNNKNKQLKIREEFDFYSDNVKIITGGIDDICTIVMADKLDILVFPEIGLDSEITPLSYLRLAPIQCTTWAHPITSGSPTIDYFLSSDLMEPENGEQHYSETLVRLPNIGFSVECPKLLVSQKKRSDFEFRDDAIIYFCCQNLFKYLPQHDYIYPLIAQQNKFAQFAFIDSYLGSTITNSFKKRIDESFKKFNLNYEQYCIFLPRLSSPDYFRLNELSDIFLDCLSWSGGITTREAISCSLPVVTCPDKMMRARHSYGMLHMIGVTETIAKTEAEYIEIAVRLGLDKEWRQRVKDRMMANKNLLFDDRECIKGLETFFEEAIQKYNINLKQGEFN